MGGRVIDRAIIHGNKTLFMEIKYSLPNTAGTAQFTRLIGQLNAMINNGNGQILLWTLRPMTQARLMLLYNTLGFDRFNKIQFCEGVIGLWQYLRLFFGV
jgi:hypothetical protein